MSEDIAVTKFREYLRINTAHPKPDYAACEKFLFSLADELGIKRKSVEAVPGKPFVIMTIPGAHPELASVVLYSHTDVVPASKDQWKHDPYSAHKDEHGNIFARGTQDMKSVGIQYFEAIRRHFKRGKKQWLRTVHIVWAPDEEIGAADGMQKFVTMPEFKELNLGFMLDEGLANEGSAYKIYYAERNPWWLEITCEGTPGHGSKFIANTAAEKLQSIINSALTFREEQRLLLEKSATKRLGEVISVNLTKVEGGVLVNIVPEKFTLLLDIRLPPTANFKEMDERIVQWCQKAGSGVTCRYLIKNEFLNLTTTEDSDPFWAAFKKSMAEEKCEFEKDIFPGSTDSRFVRKHGYRAIGFSPMNNTPSLLHDHDEYLNENVFLRGVKVYETLIDNLASVRE
ncbi:unnamed protein product [Cylicocyclus nassatus]|uniref:N-acyl-aliphatic-L-amino acid amidohydrolase n=1 Tax=Cylicocyclus nassatus TaxID=53992 RepID=A0AA36GYW5_CYLNA|nr:unnamed protein product [Cylicocyclus nassatus]